VIDRCESDLSVKTLNAAWRRLRGRQPTSSASGRLAKGQVLLGYRQTCWRRIVLCDHAFPRQTHKRNASRHRQRAWRNAAGRDERYAPLKSYYRGLLLIEQAASLPSTFAIMWCRD
jgi:hypothetical protein